MPEIQAIDEFKKELTQLGNEPEIRSQRGEAMPNIAVPESQSVDDLSALFDDDAADGESLNETAPFDEYEAGEDDFNLPAGLTEGLSDDLETEESPVPPEDESSGFNDLDNLFEDQAVTDLEDDALPEVDEPSDELIEDESLEEFSEPSDFDSGIEDFSLDDESPEELPEAGQPIGDDDFSLDDFSMDDESPPELPDAEIEDFESDEPAGLDEPIGDDDFSLDDFSMDEDSPSELPDSGIEDFENDESAGADEPIGDDDFNIDEFSTDDLDDEIESFSMDDESPSEFADAGIEDSIGDDDFSLEDFSLGEIDGDDIDAAEFSLGDLGQEFGVDDEIESDVGQLENLEINPEDAGGDFGDAYSDDNYAIPDDEYIDLKRTLGQMPRNLKLIIEELIGEKNLAGENLDKLVQALIAGKGAKDIGAIVSKITGKKIKIPTQYERRSAEEFEKEKGSFGYIFQKNFIPMFRTAALAAIFLGLILFLGYRFVYTPLHAESLYRKGYEEIPLGNNTQANTYFNEAFGEWQKKSWFYDYSESFIEQKQYILAEEKYEQLLGWYPDEREAVLDYAELEFKILGKYPEAEKLLNDLLFDKMSDYDARLMLGDTYMEWAREIDSSKYEDARFNYAKLLEQYGGRDQLLFRMLRYFIRTDNNVEAMGLYTALRQNEKVDVEPDIYAELAGYLIDKGQFTDVREILMDAKAVDAELPEIHYELARYFDIIDIPYEEEKALAASIWLFENTNPRTRTRNGKLIDAYNRYGSILYEKELYLDAEDYYQKAAVNYDEALAAGQIKPEPKYGEIFSNLGDLSYYISGDYDQALNYYNKSELNEFSPEILNYKRGYIYYNREDFREALIEFYDTAGGFSVERPLLYSTANTLFDRNDYYLAEGYYTHLLDLLEKEYSTISYLLIDEIPEHRALLENMMKVSNNLGVTKYRLYERSRAPEKNAEAMVLLTDSVEYYDRLSRDPISLVEPDTVNLSYLNSKAIFYPVKDYRLQIYQDIPKDLEKISF